jgi:Arc/MetJ-type ribon-helix-helix transcriptional regulator
VKAKQRLSASVDEDVLEAAHEAVSAGRAANVSAWVNEALHRQAEHDRRLRALDEFLSAYEEQHGVITDDEIREASRRAREKSWVVRGTKGKSSSATPAPRPRRRGAA